MKTIKNDQLSMFNAPFIALLLLSMLCWSCSELFEPVDENHRTFERVINTPGDAEGLLAAAYLQIPAYTLSELDAATDNAVSNNKNSDMLRMATGQWSAAYNPVSNWNSCFSGILSVNQFLEIMPDVNWKKSVPYLNELYLKRFNGEAHAVRAFLKFNLLLTVAGIDANGELSGIPIVNEYLTADADFNIPRASFAESVQSIYNDIDTALVYLTMDDYKDVNNEADLPAGYGKDVIGSDEQGRPLFSNYNVIFGTEMSQRISGRIVKALRARVALLAASPAFNIDADLTLWEKAAEYAGELLRNIGGMAGLDPVGHRWYQNTYVNAVSIDNEQPEIIWRRGKQQYSEREADNFPPTFYGRGRINPTQNLIDAFPMQNGYPYRHASAGYDPRKPYDKRDPRLDLYILRNGSRFKGTDLITGAGGKENAKDSVANSTRTGYYLRKLLVEETSLDPMGTTYLFHYDVFVRWTEIFLAYAEAANEAWGPAADPKAYGFTARDVIRAIRRRAGIDQPDAYLNSITGKADMRTLIRNERRLELCFEGFRFWDLRRWKENLNEAARGVEINVAGTSFNYIDVEQRRYGDYMYFGPLPQEEVLKYNELIQNNGW